jgi:hypothetical protein
MKKLMIHSMALLATAFIASTTLAHDPSEHMTKNEEPKCAGMDHSKMDMTDPVAQAMMEQCSMSGDKQKMEMKHSQHKDMHSSEKESMKMKMKTNHDSHDENQH